MGTILTLACKVKSRGVPNIWPISETGRANILKPNIDYVRYIFENSVLDYGYFSPKLILTKLHTLL